MKFIVVFVFFFLGKVTNGVSNVKVNSYRRIFLSEVGLKGEKE